MKILSCSPKEVKADLEKLLLDAGPLDKVSVCCINMYHGTPDENVIAMYEVVDKYRRFGA